MEKLPPPPLPPWLDRMLPFERFRVRTRSLTFHVTAAGSGTTVLLVHGNPAWGFLWRKVMAELADAPLRLVAPDLPGLGFSERPPRHTLEEHGRLLGELIDALEPGRLVVALHDWGGPIGLAAMAKRAERLAGLVVLNTLIGTPRPGFRPTAFHRFGRLPVVSDLAFQLGKFPASLMALAQGDRASIRGPVRRAYLYPLSIRDRAPLLLTRMVPDSLEHESIPAMRRGEELVRSFRGPVEIVWGERDPILGRALRRVQEHLPDAPVTRTSAGHFLQEEVPEAIAAAIRRVAMRS